VHPPVVTGATLSGYMAEMVSTNQFKNGMHIDVEGTVFRIVEFQHVKPGKGGAFVRTKLKAFSTGAVIDRTFRAGEKFLRIITSVDDMQFLYDDGADVVLMNTETYEQVHLPRTMCEEELRYVKEGDTVQLLSVDGKPATIQLPAAVELEVVETEPGVKGDTVSNVTKSARLETGATVAVPLFVNVGDRIRVDTREGRYIARA